MIRINPVSLDLSNMKFDEIKVLNMDAKTYKLYVSTALENSLFIYVKLPFLKIANTSAEIKSDNAQYHEVTVEYDEHDNDNKSTFDFLDSMDKAFIKWITSNRQHL